MHEVLVNCLFKLAQESVVRLTGRPARTIAADLGRKATKQTNKTLKNCVKMFDDKKNKTLAKWQLFWNSALFLLSLSYVDL